MKIDPSKLWGFPDPLRGHLFGDGIGERVIAEPLGDECGQEKNKIEKRRGMIDK